MWISIDFMLTIHRSTESMLVALLHFYQCYFVLQLRLRHCQLYLPNIPVPTSLSEENWSEGEDISFCALTAPLTYTSYTGEHSQYTYE